MKNKKKLILIGLVLAVPFLVIFLMLVRNNTDDLPGDIIEPNPDKIPTRIFKSPH